jgi:hypothetical protein
VSEAQPTEPLTLTERDELARLRAEVATLRERAAAPPPGRAAARRPRRGWLRTTAAVVLVTLGCLLAPLSVAAVWAKSQITDTDRYVATVAPMAEDPAVQAAVTDDVTNRILGYVDVQALTTEAVDRLVASGTLPPELAGALKGLATPISNGVAGFVHDQVANVVSSPAFADAWEEANRIAHEQVVGALTGQGGGAASIENGTVTVNLGPIVQEVKTRLVDRGFSLAERIPAVDTSFTVYSSEDLAKVQDGLRLLTTLGTWMPVVVLVLLAAGVYVARSHRLALVGAGLGVAAAMLVMALALVVVRARYLDAVPTDRLPRDAAGVLFDDLVAFLREGLRAVLVLGLVVGLAAFFTGPSVTAERTRGLLVRGVTATRNGLERTGLHLEPVTRWVAPKRMVLIAVLIVVAAAVLVISSYPSAALVLWLTVGVLAGLFVVQLLATPSPSPVPTPPPQRRP